MGNLVNNLNYMYQGQLPEYFYLIGHPKLYFLRRNAERISKKAVDRKNFHAGVPHPPPPPHHYLIIIIIKLEIIVMIMMIVLNRVLDDDVDEDDIKQMINAFDMNF